MNPSAPDRSVDIDAYLDSGAEHSLLNGWIAEAIGLELISGRRRPYGPIVGPAIEGRIHSVQLSHPNLGAFNMNIGFSTEEINREILGRDFLSLVQVGFRERHLVYYVTPTP